jgi:predicted CXXCH cytochrome family protein
MKGLKLSLVILVSALVTLGLNGMAHAFHSGGVADCGGCHSMHSPKTGGSFLLINSDQSSTCLSCHSHSDTAPSSYHIMTYPVPGAGIAPAEMTPGGDFAYLGKAYTFTVRGTTTTEFGQTHGHNVVAADFGMTADTQWSTAPGGTFPTASLACNSCHDPHGKYRRIGGDSTYTISNTGAPIIGSGSYNTSLTPTATQAVGSYRLLAGIGYQQGTLAINYPGAPIASAPSTYNRTEAATQTRVAYGTSVTGSGKTTWGQWCATCHTGMHSTGNYVHPIDQGLGSIISGLYQTYKSSGNMTGSNASSYLSLVPFMENTGDYTILKSHAVNDNSQLGGPATTDQVSCLSCHRAHASGFPDMLRWQMQGEFITYVDGSGNPVWPGTDTTPSAPQFALGRTSAETLAAYYNRPATVFGAYQRVLCNKCHAQD